MLHRESLRPGSELIAPSRNVPTQSDVMLIADESPFRQLNDIDDSNLVLLCM